MEFYSHQLVEGGNVSVSGENASKIDIRLVDREVIKKAVSEVLITLNQMFQSRFQKPIWSKIEVLNGSAFNGSSEFLFDPKVKTEFLIQNKPTFGDLDITVPGDLKQELGELLGDLEGKMITPKCKYIGSNKSAEDIGLGHQYNTIFQFSGLSEKAPKLNVQIDFEMTEYVDNEPSVFTKFAHSSHLDDLAASLKGFIHKFLVQSLAGASTKLSPADAVFLTDKSTAEKYKVSSAAGTEKGKSQFVFSVDKGMRQKMIPVMGKDGKQIEVDGKPAWKARPTGESEYQTKLEVIAQHMFGDNFDMADLPKLWSAVGLIELMKKYSSKTTIQGVFDELTDKMFGRGAQHINQTVEEDQKVKLPAWVAMVEAFPFINQDEAKAMFKKYYSEFEQRQSDMTTRKAAK